MVEDFCKPPDCSLVGLHMGEKFQNLLHLPAKTAKNIIIYEKIRRFEHSKIYRYEKLRYCLSQEYEDRSDFLAARLTKGSILGLASGNDDHHEDGGFFHGW